MACPPPHLPDRHCAVVCIEHSNLHAALRAPDRPRLARAMLRQRVAGHLVRCLRHCVRLKHRHLHGGHGAAWLCSCLAPSVKAPFGAISAQNAEEPRMRRHLRCSVRHPSLALLLFLGG
eukprot:365368-Chlamydomonas_euryale.AAC.4